MIGIGIDTGGTYTDAVIYDLSTREILAEAKSLTTRDDLKKGISKALLKLPQEEVKKGEMLALSTTLATNACVENKGGHARLIFIGVSEKTFDETGKNYGIENKDDVYFLDCEISNAEDTGDEPDWELFRRDLPKILDGCQGIGIVQLFSKKFGGNYEIKAREIVQEYFKGPVVLGKDLFSDLNAIKRGAGVLLNARLIPVIQDFLEAVGEVFSGYGVSVPPVIVRSDGSLMNGSMACEKPVETLLCGPATSMVGATYLAKEDNAMIVDMGGTTTDIAITKNGTARTVTDGIHIGVWKTFVKGLFVDTFGLGGDTAVHYDRLGRLYLENYRILPISNLAHKYPYVVPKLMELLRADKLETFPLHEFLVLIKTPGEGGNYTEMERSLCEKLKDGPMMLEEAADAVGKDLYNFHTGRLERNGFIIRAGFTPTDAMVMKGDYVDLDSRAARLAAEFIERATKIRRGKLADQVYDLVMKRLYCNLVRILVQTQEKAFAGKDLDEQMMKLIEISYEQKAAQIRGEKQENGMTMFDFHTDKVLVGVGAPTHVFLEPVAKMLGTSAVIPPHAAVANAIGAIVGNVTVRIEAEIMPVYTTAGVDHYEVYLSQGQRQFKEYEEARACIETFSREQAEEEARRRGAKGDLLVEVQCERQESPSATGALFLGEKYLITVQGKLQEN